MKITTNIIITFDKVKDKKALDSFMEGDFSGWKMVETPFEMRFMMTHMCAAITDPETFIIDQWWEE